MSFVHLSDSIFPIYKAKNKKMDELGIDIIKLGEKINETYNTSETHRHEFYEFFLFIKAEGIHEIDFHYSPVTNNSVHIVAPGQVHRLSVKNVHGYVICFSEEFICLRTNTTLSELYPFFKLANSSAFNIDEITAQNLTELIERLYKDYKLSTTIDTELVKHYIHIVLIKFRIYFEQFVQLDKSIYIKNAKVIQFKELINKNYLFHKSIAAYAAELNVSANHLNALCKKHEGVSAIHLVHQRLLLESKRMLAITDLSIKEIAFTLRFEEMAYFIRFFKKNTGETPGKYRSDLQNKY
jgi:AraC family transcriptional regulator, transcriptional activator of pobA